MKRQATSNRRYFKELRFQQLRALVEVSRQKSFSGAAAVLGLATPSVWQQVRGLEAEFDVELLRMHGKSIDLTEEGHFLVDAARPVVEGFDSLHDIFAQRAGSLPKRLVVASTIQLLTYELREPLAEFRRLHPDVQLSIIDWLSARSRECLENGEADIAIVGQLEPETQSAFAPIRLSTYPFVLIAPAGHPLLTAPRVTIKQIAREPLVLPNAGANTRSRLDKLFRGAGMLDKLNVAVDASNFELLVDYVVSGFGISVLPVSPMFLRQAFQGDRSLRAIGFRDLTRQFGEETIVLLRRAGRFEPPHQRAFWDLVQTRVKAG